MAHVFAAAPSAYAQSLASYHEFSADSPTEAMPWRRYEVRPCEGGREKGYVYEDSDGDEIESKDRVLWGVPNVGRVRVFQKGEEETRHRSR